MSRCGEANADPGNHGNAASVIMERETGSRNEDPGPGETEPLSFLCCVNF